MLTDEWVILKRIHLDPNAMKPSKRLLLSREVDPVSKVLDVVVSEKHEIALFHWLFREGTGVLGLASQTFQPSRVA